MSQEQGKITNKSKVILVVEDEEALVENLSEVLQFQAYRVLHSSTAQDAMAKMSNQVFDLVIVDINLKLGTGDRIVQSMRDGIVKLNKQTPVILTSGHLNRPLLDQIGNLVQGAFVKPYSMVDLLTKIQSLL